MELFVWDERYLTGETLVDAEHQGLVALVNTVVALQSQADSDLRQNQVIDELARYASEHFQHEEALMARWGCDARHVDMHKGLHRDFARQVAQMRGSGALQLDVEHLLRFLSGWLAYHILGVDQAMTRQLRHIRAGMSAAEAFAREAGREADPATASLLQAMQALNSVVVQQNRQLQDFNAQLELKVQARTRDLELRNAELHALNQQLGELRQQLVQTEKLASLGQLAAGVAHEINNPIGFVQSNIRTLKEYLQELLAAVPEEAAGKLDLAFLREDIPELLLETQEGIERVTKIVQDLRDFSQVDRAGQWGWNRLDRCLDSSLSMLAPMLAGVRVLREPMDLPEVWCNASLLSEVFLSLLRNACEALPKSGGEIRIAGGVSDGVAWIEFTDNGRGIAPEILPRIFDPFFTTKAVGGGTGMGLAQAWGIMQQHRGSIEARSELGVGSTLRVRLPLGPQ